MYEQARLKALEELMIELLKSDPVKLDALLEASAEPILFAFRNDQSDEARSVREYQLTVRAAKRQLLTRAKYTGGLLSEYELAELVTPLPETGVGAG